MSIEERAYQHYPIGKRGDIIESMKADAGWDGYVLGATEQQKIDIEKAYSIFKELLDEYYEEKDGTEKYVITFEQFKQAMEE